MDIENLIIQSTNQYLEYLRNQNKGKNYIYLRNIGRKAEKNIFVLFLDAPLIAVDDFQISYRFPDQREYMSLDRSDYQVLGYDDVSKRLLISPVAGCDLFQKLPYDSFRIESDMTFLIANLQKWFKNHPGKIHYPPNPICDFTNEPFPSSLSDEQINAVKSCLRSPLSYVWGAPGTGKTRAVLSQCILKHIEKKNYVLVIAPTNNAVDQSLRGVLGVLEENGYDQKYVLRLGVPTRDFLNDYPEVCENYSAVARVDELKKIIEQDEKLLEARRRYEKQEGVCNQYGQLLTEYLASQSSLEEIRRKIRTQNFSHAFKNFDSQLLDIEAQIKSKQKRADYITREFDTTWFKVKNFLSSDLRGSREREREQLLDDVATLEDRTASVKDNIAQLQDTQHSMQAEETEWKENLRALDRQLATLSASYSSKFDIDYRDIYQKLLIELQRYIEILGENTDTAITIKLRLDREQQELQALSEQQSRLYQSALVYACTMDTFISRYSEFVDDGQDCLGRYRKPYCQIFLDEAAYCSLPKCSPLFSLDLPVAFFGDHMQLPPVCEMNRERILREAPDVCLWAMSAISFPECFNPNASSDYFIHAYARNDPPSFYETAYTALTHTYRFGDNLASILSDYVYPASFSGSDDFDTRILLIDIKTSRSIEKKPRQSTAEANAIRQYIESYEPTDFAILAPYRNQRDLLKRTMPQYVDNIFTIHSSQGREFDTIILSVVDTTDLFMTNTRNASSNGLQVINTAISRAKKEIIICCDADFWRWKTDQLIGQLVNAATPIHKKIF
ncbi:MAG: hypothetical protein J6R04_05480 [Clostridia bacterium]|nr:hypothetical protein [Clostridia bacterium]